MKLYSWWQKSVFALVIIFTGFNLSFCAYGQASEGKGVTLRSYAPVYLKIVEETDFESAPTCLPLKAVVMHDVYSEDGKDVLIKESTPARVFFSVEPNGSWGKSGRIYLTHASTKAVDGREVVVNINTRLSGQSYTGFCIAASIVVFPLGLLSGLIKGDIPTIKEATMLTSYVIQDYQVNIDNTANQKHASNE